MRCGLVILAAAGALGSAGCGEGPAPATPVTVLRGGDCAKVPRRLEGSYYLRTRREDLPPELADVPAGLSILLLGPEHHGFLRDPARSEHLWPVCVKGAALQFPATGRCAGRSPGAYRWRLDGDRLRLTRVADDCLLRAHLLTAAPYRWFNESGWNCRSRPDCPHKVQQVELLEKTGDCQAAGCSGVPGG